MDQLLGTIIAATIPTLAVIAAFVRNETALANVNARIDTLTQDMNSRIETLSREMNSRIETLDRDLRARLETLHRDLREWARITMQHNTDIARLKDKAGLTDQK